VLALRVGRPLLIENLDPLVHNVHLRARRNPDSNQVQAAGAAELVYEFHRAELSIPVQCDIHPWMGAWLHVLDNPWFAVSDGAGEARIEGLPAGKYSVELLHEALGRRRVVRGSPWP
jgi:hypothetical protein